MNKTIQFSNGDKWEAPIIVIEEDLHNERAGYFRAFYQDSLESNTMVTVIGYCSPGGSQKTITACVAEVRKFDRETPIFRNGRKIA